jgi:trigger factor
MSAKMEQVEKNVVKLTIEVDAATFDDAMEKSYAKNKGRYALQGFRKGKAPRRMIERMYGESVFYEDAINIACPPAYEKAIEELGLDPVDRPEIDVGQIAAGSPLVFTATVTVKPEVVLGQYLGLSVEKDSVLITDEEVEKELERIRERNSRLITVEDRAVQNGDNVVIDFQGYSDGVAFEGGTGKDYSLVIGSGSFIPGFEEQLVGVEQHVETEVNVVFPENYHSSELAGKEARFVVTVNEIKYREKPDLDDEFAKDVSEFDTLDAYEADIRKNLTARAAEGAGRKFEDAVLKAAAANMTVEIPEAMVETQLNGMLRQFEMNLRYQGMDLKKYMAMMGMQEEQLRADFRDGARENVRTQLLLEAVVKAEGIEASEEMIEAELADMAKQYGQTVAEIREQLHDHDMEHVMERACSKEAIKRMSDSAVSS